MTTKYLILMNKNKIIINMQLIEKKNKNLYCVENNYPSLLCFCVWKRK